MSNLNTLDKIIGWISPEAGLRRARARAASQVILGYEGVRSDRRQGGWLTTGTSGNAEMSGSVAKLRDNARDLTRNNPYARRAVREWSKRVVGTGINPRPKTGNEAVDNKILGLWDQWSTRCMSDRRMPFSAAQKLIVSSTFVSGESLVRLWDRRSADKLAVPFQIQLLESDHLDTGKTGNTDTGYIIHGVQFNKLGVIEGYWLFGQHPGDVVSTNVRGLSSRFIPAASVLHHVEIERPGDVRAVSRFAAVMGKLRDLDEMADAVIVRKKIEACMTAFISQPDGVDGPTAGAVATDSMGKKIETFQPGMVMYGTPGTSAEFFAPTSNSDYSAYKKTELREVAVGLDIPYILLDDNMEAVNYSSFRGGLLAYRDAIEEYRWNWLIPQVLDPIWAKFIDTLFLMGEIPEPNYAHEWDPPPFDLLDRAAEAEADRAELQIGKKTWPQLIGERGYDPKAQIQEIAAWKQPLEDAGVTFAGSLSQSISDGSSNGQNQNQPPTA
jgi:lambda family phage portal protein